MSDPLEFLLLISFSQQGKEGREHTFACLTGLEVFSSLSGEGRSVETRIREKCTGVDERDVIRDFLKEIDKG